MTDNSHIPTAAVLIIGNEILSGRTQDSNLNMIAKKLFATGIKLAESRVVADIEGDIIGALNALRSRYSYVFTTGGIGPTHDDITAASVAKAFGVSLFEHPEARAKLAAYYTEANVNPARLRMAQVPMGARLIDNPVSAAPGFAVENVYVMAGVPSIATAMIDNVMATLRHGPEIHVQSVNCNIGESLIASELASIAEKFSDLDIGSYPSFRMGKVGLALVVRGIDQVKVEAATTSICAMIKQKGGEPIIEA